MKCCGKCKIEKDDRAFSASDFNKAGGWCKDCNKEYKKNYYKANGEKIKKDNNIK